MACLELRRLAAIQTMSLWRKALVCWLALVWMCFRRSISSDLQLRQGLPVVIGTVKLNEAPDSSLIPLVCQATRYPDLCTSSLYANVTSGTANSTELVRTAITLGWTQEQECFALIQDLLRISMLNRNATSAALVCEETLHYGSTTLATCRDSLLVKPVQDIQAWLSAALQFHYDCFSALSNVMNPPDSVVGVILPRMNSTMQVISNALCMTDALAAYGSDPSGWKPPPETRPANLSSALTDISPEWRGQNFDVEPWRLSNLLPNVTVSQEGSSNYSSVQAAIDNAPTNSNERYIIYIKEGIYSEPVRVHQNKTKMTFVGDGVNRTILTGNKNVSASSPGISTFQTASVVVVGDGFIASGITFQNSAGPNVSQAVAVRVDGDLCAFQDCSFDAYQDTLYAHTGRQFYRNCTILGTVDFIFGNSAAVFQNCQLVVRLNRQNVGSSFVTAQGRIDPGQTTGLVFQNCTITSTSDYNQGAHRAYLGRPWKMFSRTIFVSTYMEPLINPAGWFPWAGDFALDSLLYAEYGSFGPGAANLSSRVSWSNQLTKEQAQHFSVDSFIQGSWWLPSTDGEQSIH